MDKHLLISQIIIKYPEQASSQWFSFFKIALMSLTFI